MFNNRGPQNRQEEMYFDIVQLVASIARKGFNIDVSSPLFSGIFQRQLENHHQDLVMFICKYVPVEPTPVQTFPSVVPAIQQAHTNPQPVVETNIAPWPVATSEQSG